MVTFTCSYGTFALKRMPFVWCTAPATFQCCMMSIFADMRQDTIEMFMDDISNLGDSFGRCLSNLARCSREDCSLVLNWKKCNFLVREGIMLGHHISNNWIEVYQDKVELLNKLDPPISFKGLRSFPWHARFYGRFSMDISKIWHPLCKENEMEC